MSKMGMERFKLQIKTPGAGIWIFSGQHNTLEHNHSRCLKSLTIKQIYMKYTIKILLQWLPRNKISKETQSGAVWSLKN